MIKEYEKWLIPNQYSNIPADCCTYRDSSSIFVFYDSGELDYCDLLKDNNHIWYGGKQWVVQKDYGNKAETIASTVYCESICAQNVGWYYAMKRSTLNSVFSTLNTSPMANRVIEIIKGLLEAEGYDDLFFDHTERGREYLMYARAKCESYRNELESWRSKSTRSVVSLDTLIGES